MADLGKNIDATLRYLSGTEAGDAAAARKAKEIVGGKEYREQFLDGYIEAALWSSHDNSDPETGGDPLDKNYGPEDVTSKTKAKMRKECDDFIRKAKKELTQAFEQGMNAGSAGHDFWLTRNGHGAGYWDRDLGDVGDELSEKAKQYGERYLYAENGKVYQE